MMLNHYIIECGRIRTSETFFYLTKLLLLLLLLLPRPLLNCYYCITKTTTTNITNTTISTTFSIAAIATRAQSEEYLLKQPIPKKAELVLSVNIANMKYFSSKDKKNQ